ncbi:MAG: hypothetical protein JO115_13225 [Pseudonocardiales bacterium]|nr:hypothetical protein [Pseudonocardiales bacterium]
MNRKQFIQTTTLGVGTLTAGPMAAPSVGSGPTPALDPIGAAAVEQVRAAVRLFQLWNRGYGGGPADHEVAQEALRAELRLSMSLLRESYLAPVRAQLLSAVDDLRKVAATMNVNVDALEEPAEGPTSR